MPEYLSPGVYIEEVSGPEPIEGVSTSITGFVGVTQRGPFDTNPPVLVTSFPEFAQIFGGYFTPTWSNPPAPTVTPYNLLPHAVAGFFNNGGQLLYIKRVGNGTPMGTTAPAPSQAAELQTGVAGPAGAPDGTYIQTRLAAPAYASSTTLQLQSMRGIQNGSTIYLQNVTVHSNNTITSAIVAGPFTVTAYVDATGTVTLNKALASTYSMQNTTVSVAGAFPVAAPSSAFALYAANPGAWGNTNQTGTQANSLEVQIQPSSRAMAQVTGIASVGTGSNNVLILNSASNFYAGAVVEINTTTKNATSPQKFYAKISSITGNSIQLVTGVTAAEATAIHSNFTASPVLQVWIRTCEFDILATYGNVSESFRGLTLDNTTPYYYATTLINGSTLLSPSTSSPPTLPTANDTTPNPSTMPMALDGLNILMMNGSDGQYPLPNDYIGSDGGPGNRTGIAALIDVDGISIIAAPGITDPATQEALITQCETLLYRFAILDPAPSATGGTPALSDIQSQRLQFDTKYAAIYYPRLVVDDPLTGNNLTVPPSGHVAGIYAQTDDSRGVWKAPANVVINGILNLELKLSKGDQDILNPEPNNINALRDFTAQGRGLRVYGARCITSYTEWMYINVRRLFIFLEASLDQGTQWAVFEPNDQTLWNRLIQSVSNFLTTVWREGGLMGTTADQAYFVKCGYDTMSQDDIENGRMIMLVGVAPVFPAEFVIIRIGQWAGGSSVQEL